MTVKFVYSRLMANIYYGWKWLLLFFWMLTLANFISYLPPVIPHDIAFIPFNFKSVQRWQVLRMRLVGGWCTLWGWWSQVLQAELVGNLDNPVSNNDQAWSWHIAVRKNLHLVLAFMRDVATQKGNKKIWQDSCRITGWAPWKYPSVYSPTVGKEYWSAVFLSLAWVSYFSDM